MTDPQDLKTWRLRQDAEADMNRRTSLDNSALERDVILRNLRQELRTSPASTLQLAVVHLAVVHVWPSYNPSLLPLPPTPGWFRQLQMPHR